MKNSTTVNNTEQSEKSTSTLDAAISLAASGVPIFPCGEKKNPLTPKGFYDATTDPAIIETWWEKYRNPPGIGMPTGEVSNTLILDVDAQGSKDKETGKRTGPTGPESLKKLEEEIGPLPKTRGVWTGGGGYQYHFSYQGCEGIGNSASLLGPGLDIRGQGGYGILPPSRSYKGKYTWENKGEKADPPQGLIDKLRTSQERSPSGELANRTHLKDGLIRDGTRNETLFKLASSLEGRGLPEEMAVHFVEEVDAKYSEEPGGKDKTDKSAQTIVHEVYKRYASEQEKSDSAYSAYSAYSPQDEVEWVEPTAFHSFDRPDFPTGIFPSWMEDYVDAVSLSTQTPRDLPGMLGISVGAAALAKKMEVEVWDGWFEPLNLYTVIVLRPGTRKSEVYRRMTAPLSEVEEKLIKDSASEIARVRSRKNILEARLKKAEKDAASDETSSGESMLAAMAAAQELSEAEVPSPPQLVIDDATPEALEKEISSQGGRMALMSPEGGIFDIMAGRYSGGEPNLEVYLKGHAGDDLASKRLGRDPVVIKRPALSIALCVQPSVLQGLAGKPGFRGRGLLGRFLYSVPPDNLGRREIRTPAVPKEVEEKYQEGVKTLLNVKLPTTPTTLHLSAEAQDIMEGFSRWIEPQLSQDGDLGGMTDWAGKLAGAVARIAAGLHVMDQELPEGHPLDGDEEATTITADTLQRAVKLGKYLLAHAKYALAFMGTDPVVEHARWMLGWIRKTEGAEFSRRDAFNASRHIFDTVRELDPVLDLLLEHGYLRKKPVDHPGPGQKPSPRFEVNPLFLHPEDATQNTQNTQNGSDAPNPTGTEARGEV